MHFTMAYERAPDDPRSGPVTIGWLREPEKGGVLYDPPERVIFRQTIMALAK